MGTFRFELSDYLTEARKARSIGFPTCDTMGVTHNQALELATAGDPSLVNEADVMLQHFERQLGVSLNPTWARDVVGSRVDVPAYLAGAPNCFRRRVKREREAFRTVRIYVNGAMSFSVSAKDAMKRGIAILALIRQLQASRVHVECYVTADGYAATSLHCQAVRLPDPLDLSTHAFLLAHPAFFRHIMHAMVTHLDKQHHSLSLVTNSEIRKTYGMNPKDIYCPFLSFDDPAISDPERWVQEHVKAATS